MSLYDRLCNARDLALVCNISATLRDDEMKVLSQLMNLAFNNIQSPDELPRRFFIKNIERMDTEFMERFLKSVNLEVRCVLMVATDWVKGRTFEVELV